LRVSLGTENPWNRIVSFFEGGRSELFKKAQSSTAIEFRKLRIFRWSCGASKRLKKQWRQHLQSLIIFGHFDGGTVSWHMLGLRIRHPKTWQVGIWRMFRCMWSLLYRNYQLPMPWSNGNCTCFTGHQNSCGMLRESKCARTTRNNSALSGTWEPFWRRHPRPIECSSAGQVLCKKIKISTYEQDLVWQSVFTSIRLAAGRSI